MVIKISQEQLAQLTQRESESYINRLHQIIVKNSPSLSDDNELIVRLKDADSFVNQHGFKDDLVKTDFLITSAYEPDFYKTDVMKNWLFNGKESVESEYVKYQKIKESLMKRGGAHE